VTLESGGPTFATSLQWRASIVKAMRGMTYLLRMVLPDRPGSLGAVATALGAAGVDIESLDVIERGPDGAVDDLVVGLPDSGLADALISAAQSVPGVHVESLRPHPRAAETVRDLDIVDALASRPGEALAQLAMLVPEAFRAQWAMVLEATPFALPRIVAASANAPREREFATPWMPLASVHRFTWGESWIPEAWTERNVELAAAPVNGPYQAILLARAGGPSFRPSELMRLAHLSGLAGTMAAAELRTAGHGEGSAGNLLPDGAPSA
jgi:ACT domain